MAEPVDINTTTVVASIEGKLPSGKLQGLDVGFSAPYAVYVHENMTAHHTVGQAKYLEAAYRDPAVQQAMRLAMRKALKSKKSLYEAMIDAANVLLRASQALVPVDTGYLKDSAFVAVTPSALGGS